MYRRLQSCSKWEELRWSRKSTNIILIKIKLNLIGHFNRPKNYRAPKRVLVTKPRPRLKNCSVLKGLLKYSYRKPNLRLISIRKKGFQKNLLTVRMSNSAPYWLGFGLIPLAFFKLSNAESLSPLTWKALLRLKCASAYSGLKGSACRIICSALSYLFNSWSKWPKLLWASGRSGLNATACLWFDSASLNCLVLWFWMPT